VFLFYFYLFFIFGDGVLSANLPKVGSACSRLSVGLARTWARGGPRNVPQGRRHLPIGQSRAKAESPAVVSPPSVRSPAFRHPAIRLPMLSPSRVVVNPFPQYLHRTYSSTSNSSALPDASALEAREEYDVSKRNLKELFYWINQALQSWGTHKSFHEYASKLVKEEFQLILGPSADSKKIDTVLKAYYVLNPPTFINHHESRSVHLRWLMTSIHLMTRHPKDSEKIFEFLFHINTMSPTHRSEFSRVKRDKVLTYVSRLSTNQLLDLAMSDFSSMSPKRKASKLSCLYISVVTGGGVGNENAVTLGMSAKLSLKYFVASYVTGLIRDESPAFATKMISDIFPTVSVSECMQVIPHVTDLSASEKNVLLKSLSKLEDGDIFSQLGSLSRAHANRLYNTVIWPKSWFAIHFYRYFYQCNAENPSTRLGDSPKGDGVAGAKRQLVQIQNEAIEKGQLEVDSVCSSPLDVALADPDYARLLLVLLRYCEAPEKSAVRFLRAISAFQHSRLPQHRLKCDRAFLTDFWGSEDAAMTWLTMKDSVYADDKRVLEVGSVRSLKDFVLFGTFGKPSCLNLRQFEGSQIYKLDGLINLGRILPIRVKYTKRGSERFNSISRAQLMLCIGPGKQKGIYLTTPYVDESYSSDDSIIPLIEHAREVASDLGLPLFASENYKEFVPNAMECCGTFSFSTPHLSVYIDQSVGTYRSTTIASVFRIPVTC